MSKDQEIRELFKRLNIPLDRDDVWAVQGTPVVKHKALERLAAVLKIHWHPPVIIRAERDEAVVLVTGLAGEQHYEWSIGEALIGQNYRVSPKVAAYPYAMAEKRGKDRVILKLAGLQGVYSEEEADDFKQSAPEPSNGREKAPKRDDIYEKHSIPAPEIPDERERAMRGIAKQSKDIYVNNSIERIAGFDSTAELLQWAKTERAKFWPQYGIDPLDEDGQRFLRVYKERFAVLESQSEAA